MPPPSPASVLRDLLANQDSNRALVVPGVYDGLTARLAHSTGFEAIYMHSGGVSLTRAGLPALSLVTSTEMADQARMLASLSRSVPLIADADNGYGPPLNVVRTTASYIDADVAAMHINDKLVDQRKGHVDGKNLCSKDEFLSRIRAAAMTREKMGSDVLIIAESYALRYVGLEDAVDRLKAAVTVGADGVFPAGMASKEECESLGSALKSTQAFLVCSVISGSRAGFRMTATEAKEIGYSIVLYAGVCVSPAFLAMKTALEHLKENGDCDDVPPEASARQVFEICGMSEVLQFDKEIG